MSTEDTLHPVDDDPVTFALLAIALAVAMVLLARLNVPYPLSDTPYSLATVGVYFAALVLGPLWGSLSLGGYLLAYGYDVAFFGPEGATTGMEVLTGPLGGYLLSYPLAALVVGALIHRGIYPKPLHRHSVPALVGALAVGILLVYPVGAVWLGTTTEFPLLGALIVGGLAYLPGEAAKAGIALILAMGGYYALDRRVGAPSQS